ncbi:MAG: ferredoxin--NADP reductase [Bacteroidota bacterium]
MAFSLFKKKKEKKDDRYQTLTVREVVSIAKDAVNLVFEKPEQFEYKPGQFITIIKEIEGKKIRRAYSLCTTPYIDEWPAITVKRVENGIMSNHLNDAIVAGDEINIMNPMGMFTTPYQRDPKRKTVFFGGGSGITPLMAILRTILQEEPHSEVALVYGNRSEEFIIFKELIEELRDDNPERFEVVHILEEGEAQYNGKPTEQMIMEICQALGVDENTECFICGPQPMMDLVSETLPKIGVSNEKVMMESFEAGKTSPDNITDQENADSEALITLDGEEFELTMKRSISVLEAALDQGIDMPYSCQSGLCTACRGKCTEGKISTDEAEGLSEEELEEGYVLTCVGRPLSDRIKIEMG